MQNQNQLKCLFKESNIKSINYIKGVKYTYIRPELMAEWYGTSELMIRKKWCSECKWLAIPTLRQEIENMPLKLRKVKF